MKNEEIAGKMKISGEIHVWSPGKYGSLLYILVQAQIYTFLPHNDIPFVDV